jgi:hypothetical protein
VSSLFGWTSGLIQGNNYVTAVDTPQNYAYIWREEKVQDNSLNTTLSACKHPHVSAISSIISHHQLNTDRRAVMQCGITLGMRDRVMLIYSCSCITLHTVHKGVVLRCSIGLRSVKLVTVCVLPALYMI